MRNARWLLMLMLAVVVASCTVGPDYEPPEVVVPESFRFGTEDVLDTTDVAWWSMFEDPALEALIDEALRNNLDVRVAAGRVEEFAARVGITRSAAFPQIGYGADAGREQFSRELGSGKQGGDRVSDFFNANLNVGWELDLWGRVRRLTESARADLLASSESRRGVILTVVTAVATGYIGLRSLDEQLMIAQHRLKTHSETLRLFRLQRAGGVISDMEVAQIKSEYERTAATIPAIERSIALLENSLSVLLGRAPGAIARGRALDDMKMPPIPAGLPSDLLRRRPDLRQREQELISANALIGAAISEFFPRVSLTAFFGYASDDLSDFGSNSAGVYQLAASVAGPIFTAGRIEGQVRAAEAFERQTLDAYLGSVLTALRESEDALVTHSTTRDEIAAQDRQVEALRTYSRLANQRYDNGYVGYLEVLDADRDLFDAELEQARLQALLQASVIGVYKAFGGGWVDRAEETSNEADQARMEAEAAEG